MKENNYSVEFDKILMQFAAGVYENKPIPQGSQLILSENDLKTGFYAEAYRSRMG